MEHKKSCGMNLDVKHYRPLFVLLAFAKNSLPLTISQTLCIYGQATPYYVKDNSGHDLLVVNIEVSLLQRF